MMSKGCKAISPNTSLRTVLCSRPASQDDGKLELQIAAEAVPIQFLLKERVKSSAAAAAAGAKNRHAADAMLNRYWRLDAEGEACRDALREGSLKCACSPV